MYATLNTIYNGRISWHPQSFVERGTYHLWAHLSFMHPTKKPRPPKGLLQIHLTWPWVNQLGANVKSTRNNNIWVVHNLRAFMLDEWEVRLYTIIPSLHLSSTPWCWHRFFFVRESIEQSYSRTIMHERSLKWRLERVEGTLGNRAHEH
jgi:hypothetical protein